MARRRGAILSDEWGLNPSGGTQQFPGPGGAIDQPTRSGRLSDLDLERQNRARIQAVRQEARGIPGRTRLTPQEEARIPVARMDEIMGMKVPPPSSQTGYSTWGERRRASRRGPVHPN